MRTRRPRTWAWSSRQSDARGEEQAQLFHHFIKVGEYALALEEIAGA
jgi:hypothetical protein